MNSKRISWIICIILGLTIVPSVLGQESTPEPPEGFTEVELEDGDVLFTFAYPEEWVTAELDSPFAAIQFASNEAAMGLIDSEELPLLQEGQLSVGVFLADQRQLPNSDELEDGASIADTAALAAEIFEGIFEDVEVCVFEAGERPAALIRASLNQEDATFDIQRILVDLGMGDESREFGDIVALSAYGEMVEYEQAFLHMAASMKVTEDGEPRPLESAESNVELPDCEFETDETADED